MELSRRDLLAGMAMQGILSSREMMLLAANDESKRWDIGVATRARSAADALIAELDKTSPQS